MEIFWQYQMPSAKTFNKRSKKHYIQKTANKFFEKFRERGRNIPDMLSLYREGKKYQNGHAEIDEYFKKTFQCGNQGSCRSAE